MWTYTPLEFSHWVRESLHSEHLATRGIPTPKKLFGMSIFLLVNITAVPHNHARSCLNPIFPGDVQCVSETFGTFGGFSRSGPFPNVATDSLHLHIRVEKIATIFALNPTDESNNPGMRFVQFFDSEENSCFKVFLIQRQKDCPEPEEWSHFDWLISNFKLKSV